MIDKPFIPVAIAITMLVWVGCKPPNSTTESRATGDANSSSVTQQWQNAKETVSNAWEQTKEGTTNAWANVKESLQTGMDYTYDKKDAFVAAAANELDALDQKITELSDKAASASDSIKADAKAKIQDLRAKRDTLDKKLDAVKNATVANWNEVKAGFQTAYDDTKDSLKQAWQWLNDKLNS